MAVVFTALALGCSSEPTSPGIAVRVDVAISTTTVRADDVVILTLVATNPTQREALWSSGCGSDLGFEVRDADGQVAESPAFGLCTEEYRRPTLGPRES